MDTFGQSVSHEWHAFVWHAPFPGWMSYKATTKPDWFAVCRILACFILYCCLFGPLLCIVSFSLLCSVFWFFWLSCHYLPTDWVQRLAKPNRGEGIISIKPRPKRDLRFSWFIVLFHFFIMRLCCLLTLRDIFPTPTERYSLFVLKIMLNTKQTKKPTLWIGEVRFITDLMLFLTIANSFCSASRSGPQMCCLTNHNSKCGIFKTRKNLPPSTVAYEPGVQAVQWTGAPSSWGPE